MAADPFDALRLTLMQDVLPVGLAVVERARKGGPRQVMAAFDGSSSDPLGRLREEGEPAAGQVRESLDRLQPGLGNPVMKVEVRDVEVHEVDPPAAARPPADGGGAAADGGADREELQVTLDRIAARLAELERRLGPAAGATPPTA
jgi:hypothetical protein